MKKTTITDVANKAGVSVSTVSRALNNGSVHSETKQKIMEAIKDVGYHNNKYDKDFSQKFSSKKIVLVCTPCVNSELFYNFYKGIEGYLSPLNYITVICPSEKFTYESIPSTLLNISAGCILWTLSADKDVLSEYHRDLPLVLCNGTDHSGDHSSIMLDDYRAIKDATKYLLFCGKKRIAFINGPLSSAWSVNMQKGYLDALKEAHISEDPEIILNQSLYETENLASLIMAMLSDENRPDGLICGMDCFNKAVFYAASKLGLNIPEDLAVIGCSNSDCSIITNFTENDELMGYQAAKLLVQKIDDPESPTVNQIFTPELKIGFTTPK